ncbi:unnamed protein product [Ectocarpus sp. 13 AM-2016]
MGSYPRYTSDTKHFRKIYTASFYGMWQASPAMVTTVVTHAPSPSISLCFSSFLSPLVPTAATASNLPKVIVVHQCVIVAFLGLTGAVCYQIQPTQTRHPRGRDEWTDIIRQNSRESCAAQGPVFAPINNTIRNSNNAFVVRSRQSFEALILQV